MTAPFRNFSLHLFCFSGQLGLAGTPLSRPPASPGSPRHCEVGPSRCLLPLGTCPSAMAVGRVDSSAASGWWLERLR
ncbi:hypothetical protein HDK64DRAFT_26488 [Phyllosticta capitalensis]|uniref:Secreted protein n=1 Tax=Phyllosticta capitalensis TaxID=121624 RepID=A0ABR1YVW2_9PEZI